MGPKRKSSHLLDFNVTESRHPSLSHNDLQFFIQRIHFARQKRFSLDDHLFKINVKSTLSSQPKLVDILDKLREGIAQLLGQIQDLYSPENRHQIYLTIDDAGFRKNGINTGNYSLYGSGTDQKAYLNSIALDALNILANCLRSYDHLKLSEAFHIYVRVLSVPHMKHKEKKGVLKHVKEL